MRNLRTSLLCAIAALIPHLLPAQKPAPAPPPAQHQSGSSSSSGEKTVVDDGPQAHPSAGLQEAGGAAITLESSETLFDVAAALNACGYDADLADSSPVRGEVRNDVSRAIAADAKAKAAQDALCAYVSEHQLNDKGRELAQYVSLALYLGPPPALTPIADQSEMPPDSLQVVNVLPLLRTFSAAVGLHAIWERHHPQYEAINARWHEPVTQLIFSTNIYLKLPVSSYSGRRLLILIEPMLSPNAPNARIYGSDYIMVTSPAAAGAIRMDQIRHMYLHYEMEPLVYARASSMERLTPLLKPIADAPLEYTYKTDIVALLTECLIKAVEARTMDTGIPVPAKPAAGTRDREVLLQYDQAHGAYERAAEQVRRHQIDLDMRQGWTLTAYFYEQLTDLEHDPEGLNERMGQMVYGMDIARERHREEQIQFLPTGSGEFVRRAPAAPTGLMLAQKKMLEGDLSGADALADKALADPKQDHAEALYLKAQLQLMQGDAEEARPAFEEVARTAHIPRTQAWAHIYLGRLADIQDPADRPGAVAEYKAALAIPGAPQDARNAAQGGLKTPFAVPTVKHQVEEDADPSGKAEKQQYKPE